MKQLGIAYTDSTPQSMGDQWWFWNCSGVPEDLPEYLTPLEMNPLRCVGFGLSSQQAETLATEADRKDLADNPPKYYKAVESIPAAAKGVRTFDPVKVSLEIGGVEITGFADSAIILVNAKDA
jgi:hypothetical protein